MSSSPNFIEMEKEILDFWEKNEIFRKLKTQLAGKPHFRFIDGPITANNPMGVHHAWGRTLKDVFLRYNAMNGKDCAFQNGFDCQGLWVEVGVEKDLGLNGKPEIEQYGLDNFSRKCRARVEQYADVITQQSKRLGQWMDWDNSYYTHSDQNIQWIWKFLRKCQDNGWLQQRSRPMPWCARCGTSLSEHEMSGSYQRKTHDSVYVLAPLRGAVQTYFLVWTTTPWTLPANVAIAVNPKATYLCVELEGRHIFVSKEAKKVVSSLVALGGKIGPDTALGSELVTLDYGTFFSDLEVQKFDHEIVAWDEVDATEGTGFVHIAPGCGREDYELGQSLGLPSLSPVDENGRFLEEYGYLFDLNTTTKDTSALIAHLKRLDKLFKIEKITHSYPVCWRCKEELIFRLVDEWFIDVEEIRPQLIKEAQKVKWNPPYMSSLMEDWLQNMGGWCISRKRYWGLPLPIYPCVCGHTHVVASRRELEQLATDPVAVQRLPELHRPWIDAIRIQCPQCGQEVSRVSEVGDCWLDAGIVPYSTGARPVEWICEMREQVRLWFYSMLFMGVTLEGECPYESVTAYEKVVDEDGNMFSKTGYMIHFDEAVEQMGADTMRYLYCQHPITSDVRFGYKIGEKAQRKLMPLWNIYTFLKTYVDIDQPDWNSDREYTLLDRWLQIQTTQMLTDVRKCYQMHNTAGVLKTVEKFLDDFSNWYIRLNRRRFWKGGVSAEKIGGYLTMRTALQITLQVLAPIIPFLTEYIWQHIRDDSFAESVHLAGMPQAEMMPCERLLLEQMDEARHLLSMGLKLRNSAKIAIKQPLNELVVFGSEIPDDYHHFIAEELNVDSVRGVAGGNSMSAMKNCGLTEPLCQLNFKLAGPILKGNLSKAKDVLANMSREQHRTLAFEISKFNYTLIEGVGNVPNYILEVKYIPKKNYLMSTDDKFTVALDISLTEELEARGLLRELTRALQLFRKQKQVELTDRITLFVGSQTDPQLISVLMKNLDFIREEVLVERLIFAVESRRLDSVNVGSLLAEFEIEIG